MLPYRTTSHRITPQNTPEVYIISNASERNDTDCERAKKRTISNESEEQIDVTLRIGNGIIHTNEHNKVSIDSSQQ